LLAIGLQLPLKQIVSSIKGTVAVTVGTLAIPYFFKAEFSAFFVVKEPEGFQYEKKGILRCLCKTTS
jgi:hypothetical protein